MITVSLLASLRAERIAHVLRPAALRLVAVSSRAQPIAVLSTSSRAERLQVDRNQLPIRMPWTMRAEQAEPSLHSHSVPMYKPARRANKAKQKKLKMSEDKFGEPPMSHDICEMMGEDKYNDLLRDGREFHSEVERDSTVTCRIERLSANGDGLALTPSGNWVIAVPCVVPGETVSVRITSNERLYSRAALLSVVEKADSAEPVQRRDDLVKCKYFGKCSGCQYQHIDYDTQLTLKQDVVRRAFSHYSGLEEDQVPEVEATLASPLQYSYRTKLTPHFDLPPGMRPKRRGNGKSARHQAPSSSSTTFRDAPEDMASSNAGNKRPMSEDTVRDVAIGFGGQGTRQVVDIEECMIATQTINRALPIERKKVNDTIHEYRNGATILLRDSLKSFSSFAEDKLMPNEEKEATDPLQFDTEVVIDHKATVRERVKSTLFHSPANAFFQNNRSILPPLLAYVEDAIKANPPVTESAERYLIDTYCGSGLFALCLAPLFKRVSGVEVSVESIKFANSNAHINGIKNAAFVEGKAQEIFRQINFPRDQTTVIIDPPRRGCDELFIRQLLALGPHLIVYVSCNVHTQARDVGIMVNGLEHLPPMEGVRAAIEAVSPARAPMAQYDIVSIRGADLFPQTHHVEGVCILKRRDAPKVEPEGETKA